MIIGLSKRNIHPDESVVLYCNTPHGSNVLTESRHRWHLPTRVTGWGLGGTLEFITQNTNNEYEIAKIIFDLHDHKLDKTT